MFGLSKKEKTGHSIKLAMDGILNQSHFSGEECQNICSSEEGGAWLYTEVMIQLTNMLAFVVASKFNQHSWATMEFFFINVNEAINSHSNDPNLFNVILNGFQRIQSVDGDGAERIRKMFLNSADEVFKHDKTIDREEIADYLDEKVQLFSSQLGTYFG